MFKYSSFSNKYENYTNGGGSNFYSLSSSRIDLGGRTPLVDGDPLATAVVTARISSTTTSAGQRTRQRRWNYGSWIRIVNTNGVGPIEFRDSHPLHGHDIDVAKLKNDVFLDAVSLQTQYARCSYNQLQIKLYEGTTSTGKNITGGVTEFGGRNHSSSFVTSSLSSSSTFR